MTDTPPLPEEARAAAAHARLIGSLDALKSRLAPKTLAQNAVQGVLEKGQAAGQSGVDTARKHPAAVAGVVAAIALFFARRPLFRMFRRRDATARHLESSTHHIRAARRNAE